MVNYAATQDDTVTAAAVADPWLFYSPTSLVLSTVRPGYYQTTHAQTWDINYPTMPVGCPHRIVGLMVYVQSQSVGASTLATRLRVRTTDFDSEDTYTPATAPSWTHRVEWYPNNPWTARPWNISDLLDLEVGVVNTGVGTMTINTVVVSVSVEPVPFLSLRFNANGKYNHWSIDPNTWDAGWGATYGTISTSTAWMTFWRTEIVNNDWFTLNNGHEAVTFEFEKSGGFVPVVGRVTINITGDATNEDVAITVASVINNPTSWTASAALIAATVTTNQVSMSNNQIGITQAIVTAMYSFGGSGMFTSPIVPSVSGPSLGMLPYYDLVRLDDANLGYIYTVSDVSAKHTFRFYDTNLELLSNMKIDKVQLELRAKGAGSITSLVRDVGTDSTGRTETLSSTAWKTLRFPFYYRPAFPVGPAEWSSLEEVQRAEWGVANVSGADNMLTHARLDVFASLIPDTYQKMLPTGVGTWNDWTITAPNVGEARWEDVNSWNPDDTSYLSADATSSQKFQTFQLTNTYTGEWYGVRWSVRVKSASSNAWFAPVVIKSGVTHVGTPFHSSANAWKEYAEDYWLNPATGLPWTSTELQSVEIGIVLLEGTADLSWCILEVAKVPPVAASPADMVWQCEFTNYGLDRVNRCMADNLIWTVDRYSVGRGGYMKSNPGVVLPIDPHEYRLADEAWTGDVTQIEFLDYTAYYWCVVPPDRLGEPIGELMLWARVVSSDKVTDKVGTYFPLAVAHFPCGFHTLRSIRVLRIALTYNVNLIKKFHSDGLTTAETFVKVP